MPLKHFCRKQGCPNIVTTGYCEAHQSLQASYDMHRGSAASRGYGYKWNEYSKRFRRKNPLCTHCLKENLITPSQHVDHIVAVKGPNDSLFWDPNNHSALCASCHSRKTIEFDGGYGHG